MAPSETEITSSPLPETIIPRRFSLALECALLFIVVPVILYFWGTRWNVHLALWIAALYALYLVRGLPAFSWRHLWNGEGWPVAQRKAAAMRFVVLTAGAILLAAMLVPGRLFVFPMQRPGFWLLVMILYPILSVVPQEFVLRSFFFRRYLPLFPHRRMMIAASAFCFSFVHVVFHNPVSPLLTALAGTIIAHSYTQHRSLKWAAVEHAAYGCMVFTVGLGQYFLIGGMRV